MEIKVKIVKDKKNPKARIAIAGAILLVISAILACKDDLQNYAIMTFIAAVLALIGGAIYAKGDLTSCEVSSQFLMVSGGEIRIEDAQYPINQVQEMHFIVEAYDGMVVPGSTEVPGNSNGMNNYLEFSYHGEKIECRFYLGGPRDVQTLGLLFRELYEKKILFRESSQGRDTFMFEPVTQSQLKDLRAQNGYI